MKIIIALLSCAFICNADELLNRNERIVALTILGEARGEGKEGMFAVACVIQRRCWERRKAPDEICLQDKQFSIWDARPRDYKGNVQSGHVRESDLYYLWKSKEKMYARDLARRVCENWLHPHLHFKDTTGGANHYCHIKSNPYWTFKTEIKDGKRVLICPKQSIKPVAIIGNHKFYKLP